MFRLFLPFILSFIFLSDAFAQQPAVNGQIKGIVLDSLTAEPVAFSTITMREQRQTAVVKAG